jgi:hypothetical protein
MRIMKNHQEGIGRGRIVVGLMTAAVLAAAVAQGRSRTFRPLEQRVVIGGGAAATGGA